jgi:cell division protease FtsH
VDPETSKLLEQYNINFKGEIESQFLPTLLSWVIPVFLFFGVRSQYLNIPMEGAAEYSEATAELIDEEVRGIISKQYAKAQQILKEKREVLEKGAELLLEKEKIEGAAIKSLLDSG